MWALNRILLNGVLATALSGLSSATVAMPPGYQPDTRAYNLARGRVIFSQNCLRCHEEGRKGAPMLDDPEDWPSRLEQPLATLIAHAINGHGDMPARGETELSDQDMAAAVAYVVDRARIVVAERLDSLPAPAGGVAAPTAAASTDDAVIQMFLLLMGKDRWK